MFMQLRTRHSLLNLAGVLRVPALVGILLTTQAGCGVLSAITNPKVAWAVQDPAPMSVVVRRADSAQVTTQEVERLLTATPTGPDSEWMAQVVPDPQAAASEMKAVSQEPVYKSSHARVLPTEVWVRTLPAIQSSGGEQPNLLAAIDVTLGNQYADIASKKQDIAALTAQIETEKTAADAKDASPDEQATHKAAVSKLTQARSDREAEVGPLQKTFLTSLTTAAPHVPADQQAKYLPAVANLLQALDDADIANSAAAIRYPLAMRTMLDSVKEVVPVLAADVIEEQTGQRPALTGLKPQVVLQGTDVSITLAGIDPAELGQLSVEDLTKEVVARSGKWVVHALTLLGTVDSTKQALSFDHDVLAGLMTAWGRSPDAARDLVKPIPAADSPMVASATPAPRAQLKSHAARKTREKETASLTSAQVKKPGATTKKAEATKPAPAKKKPTPAKGRPGHEAT